MKSVLKRRKHRKGIRPVRKGTLKVNLQELPNYDGLKIMGYITQLLIAHGTTNWNDDFPRHNASSAEWNRYHINFEQRKQNLLNIRKFQDGVMFLDGNKQANLRQLALRAINETNPVYVGKRENACDTCEHKNNCPFSAVPKHLLNYACPIRREAHCKMIMKAVRDEPTDTPLSQLQMAKLAITHLS